MAAGGGFAQSANVRPTTQAEVLSAIVAKLIAAAIPGMDSDVTCFVSETPWPSVEIQDSLFCTVAPGEGQFDQGDMDGAGNQGVVELFGIIVTVWTRIQLDQIEHFSSGLLDPERGLFLLKQQILAALAGKNLDGGTYQGDSSLLLQEALFPRRSQFQEQKEDDFGSMMLAFDAKFKWDLGSQSSLN